MMINGMIYSRYLFDESIHKIRFRHDEAVEAEVEKGNKGGGRSGVHG